MEFLYPDLVVGNLWVHSEKRGGLFVLQLIRNNVVVQEQAFSDWNAYSRRYDMTRTLAGVL
jgi:hypothetical protein